MSLTVSFLSTLDGVRSDPMSWIGDLFDEEAAKGALAELEAADAFVMGRGAYEYFAPAWSGGTGPYLARINAMPKIVFSASLDRVDWPGTTLVRDDAVAAVRAMADRRLVLYGLGRLARSLLAAGLVDELAVGVQPVLAGAGRVPVRLLAATAEPTGAASLRYDPSGA
jgi:dihydrofolate reductase